MAVDCSFFLKTMKNYVTDNTSSCIGNWIGNLPVTTKLNISTESTWLLQGPANLVWIKIKNTPTFNKLCYITWRSLLSCLYNSQLTSLSLWNSNCLLGKSPLLIRPTVRPWHPSCANCVALCIHSPDFLLCCHNNMTTGGKYGLW